MLNELRLQLQTAYAEYQQAEQNFNYADSDYIETATYDLKAASTKIEAIRKQSRKIKKRRN